MYLAVSTPRRSKGPRPTALESNFCALEPMLVVCLGSLAMKGVFEAKLLEYNLLYIVLFEQLSPLSSNQAIKAVRPKVYLVFQSFELQMQLVLDALGEVGLKNKLR